MAEAPIAFSLHGFLGAGKTTFAKKLEQDQRALRFTHDEWMSHLYGDDPPEAEFPKYARRVFIVMEETWKRCLELNTNIILDFGFWSRGERDKVRELVASRGGEAIVYRFSCSDDVAWKRIEQRNKLLAGNLYIAPNTFHTLKRSFEPLAPDEDYVEVTA